MKLNIKNADDDVIIRVLKNNGLSLNPQGKSKIKMRLRVDNCGNVVLAMSRTFRPNNNTNGLNAPTMRSKKFRHAMHKKEATRP